MKKLLCQNCGYLNTPDKVLCEGCLHKVDYENQTVYQGNNRYFIAFDENDTNPRIGLFDTWSEAEDSFKSFDKIYLASYNEVLKYTK